MISEHDKANIAKLIKKIAGGISTEELLYFLADNSGMIESCENVKDDQEQNNHQTRQWFENQCLKNGITHHQFSNDLAPVFTLFISSSLEDAYATLGIKPDADSKEIKQAYRSLSRQYHPDTTTANKKEAVKNFIAVSTAYKKTINADTNESALVSSTVPAWKYKREQGIDKRGTKSTVLVISSLCIILLFVTLLAPSIYRNIVLFKTTTLDDSTNTSKTKKINSSQSTTATASTLNSSDKSKIEPLHTPEQQKTFDAPSVPKVDSQQPEFKTDIANTTHSDLKGPFPYTQKKKIISQHTTKNPAANENQSSDKKDRTDEKSPEKFDRQLSTEQDLHAFLQNYIFFYNNKDLTGFSKLFEPDALENEEPFKELAANYTKLFNSTQSLSLAISIISWEQTEYTIKLTSDFHIYLHYPSSRIAHSKGNISFILNKYVDSYKIQQLSYSFQ